MVFNYTLDTINKLFDWTNNLFQEDKDLKEQLYEFLKNIQEYFELDRSYIFKTQYIFKDIGQIRFTKESQYISPNIEQKGNDLKINKYQIDHHLMENKDIVEKLLNHNPVLIHYDELSNKDKEVIYSNNVKSIFLLPIIINNKLWGVLGFNSFSQKITYPNTYVIKFLNVQSRILQDQFIRHEYNHKIENNNKKLLEQEKVGEICNWVVDLVKGEDFVSENQNNMFEFEDDKTLKVNDLVDKLIEIHPPFKYFNNDLENGYYNNIYMFKSKNGGVKYFQGISKLFYDDNNLPYKSSGIFKDITNEYLNQIKIYEKNENIIQQQNVGNIVIFEYYPETLEFNFPNGLNNIVECNSDKKIYHYSEVLRYVYKDYKYQLINMNSDGDTHEKTIKLTNDKFIKVIYKQIFNQKQKYQLIPNKIIGILQDITKEKEIENKLKQSVKEQENLQKEKELFLSNMSHEIKTPLTSINGVLNILYDDDNYNHLIKYIEELKDSKNNPTVIIESIINELYDVREEEHDLLFRQVQQSKVLNNIISDILEQSKLKYQTEELNIQEVHLKYLLEVEMKSLFQLNIQKKGIEFNINISKNVPEVLFTDITKLKQVLINLIGNQIKFTDKGSININVFKEKKHIKFEVSDTGIGIKKEVQNKLFNKFYQGEVSFNHKNKGTGLGLFICKEKIKTINNYYHDDIVGKYIGVNSKLNEGSTFYFYIPYIKNID